MNKYFTVITLFFILCRLHGIHLKIVDQNNSPLPYVRVAHNTQFLAISDTQGIVQINLTPDTQTLTFTRLGVKTRTIPATDLHDGDTIILQTEAITQEPMNIYGKADSREITTLSHTQRIDITKTYATVDDLLKDISTIQIKGIQLTGERQTISLGGHQSRHTVVMLDNIVLNPSGQAVDLSSIPATNIESVEIVRNNVSVETGSGGIGGLVILHTRKSKAKNEFYLSESVGSYNSVKQNIGFGLYHKGFSLLANTSSVYTKNDFEYKYRDETLKRENNQKEIFNINSDLAWQSATQNIQYSLRHQILQKHLPGPTNYLSYYAGAYQDGSSTHHSLLYNISLGQSRIETSAYLLQNESTYNNTASPRPIYKAIDENKQSISGVKAIAKHTVPLGALDMSLALGGEYKKETFALNDLFLGRNSIPEVYREIKSAFGSMSLKYDFTGWESEFVGSYRLDDTHRSYRVETVNNIYLLMPFMVNANIGTSYMIPSFYDMYWIGDSQTVGNPDLLPEESLGWRVEVATDTNPSLSVAKWHNRTENLIYWYRSMLGWKPANIATADIDSWDFTGKYRFWGEQNVVVNYTRTVALDKTPDGDFYGKYIIYTVPWTWDIDLNLRLGAFSQSFIYHSQGAQHTTRDQLIPPEIKGYELFHTRSAYEIVSGSLTTTFNFQVYNVFDKRYQNYAYMPEPGRHWEVGVSLGIRN